MVENEREARVLIRNFIMENMDAFYDESEWNDSDHIFELGFVSSIVAIRLLQFIENEFGIEVKDEDIQLNNFSSVDNLIRLVSKLKGGLLHAD